MAARAPYTHYVIHWEPGIGATHTISVELDADSRVVRSTTEPAGCSHETFMAPLVMRGFGPIVAVPFGKNPPPDFGRVYRQLEPAKALERKGAVTLETT